jgi:hypothetical protein
MNRKEVLTEIREWSVFALADSDLADCGSPDNHESPGARLLIATRDAFLEYVATKPDATGEDVRDDVSDIAADLVSVYTHERWQQFADLAAYQEEPESGEWPQDLTAAAEVALYQIVERLVFALAQRLDDAECEGHESLDGAHMGETVYCDGSCA